MDVRCQSPETTKSCHRFESALFYRQHLLVLAAVFISACLTCFHVSAGELTPPTDLKFIFTNRADFQSTSAYFLKVRDKLKSWLVSNAHSVNLNQIHDYLARQPTALSNRFL